MKMPKHPDGLVLLGIWISPKKDDELQRAFILLWPAMPWKRGESLWTGEAGGGGRKWSDIKQGSW